MKGTYLESCCCRAEQIPACLQSLPVGTLALPSITQGQTGHRSLPDLTVCPGFPHFNSPLNSDLAQPCLCEAYRSSEMSFCFFFFLSLQEKNPNLRTMRSWVGFTCRITCPLQWTKKRYVHCLNPVILSCLLNNELQIKYLQFRQ